MPEKLLQKSLQKFFILYIGSLVILFIGLFYFAYNAQKEQLVNSEIQKINNFLSNLEEVLKNHHQNRSKEIKIFTNGYKIAFADIDHDFIINSIEKPLIWDQNSWINKDTLVVRHDQSVYFLGVKSIFCSTKIDSWHIVEKLLFVFGFAFIFMTSVGYFLSLVALSPAKTAFNAIDTFIKHATHDINTPISSILSNSHLLKSRLSKEQEIKIVERIMIGAKSLTMLYDDLLFLSFDRLNRKTENIKIDEIITQRIVITQQLAEYKKISITTNLSQITLEISENDIVRLVDNLLSNAIKYNKPSGQIEIVLTKEYLSIKDSGIGMDSSEINKIFNRYYRGESFENGIGIGMEIVARVCKLYNFGLEIKSQKHEGSEFIIRWSK